jgi:hypothetical protein
MCFMLFPWPLIFGIEGMRENGIGGRRVVW